MASLLTISVGLNAAYIFIIRKDSNVFLAYLKHISENAATKIIARKTSELQEETDLETKLESVS